MHVAAQATGAERAIACDTSLGFVDSLNLDQQDILSPEITSALQRALQSGQPVIANNVIKDSDETPKTNVSFESLRGIVVLPIAGQGAIYLDRLVKKGIIERDKVDKLVKLLEQVKTNGQATITEAKLLEILNQLK
jgi:hypothetical protein